MEDSEHERERRHRLLTTRQQQHVLQTLTRRLGHYVNARLEHVVSIDQTHLTAPAAKQLLEQRAEVFVDLLEGVTETFTRATLDLSQRFFGGRDSFNDVLALNSQEQQPLLGFGQLFERHHVHTAEAFEPRAQLFHSRVTRFQIEFFGERQLARKIFQRLAQLSLAVLVNKRLSRLGFGTLHFESAARIAYFSGTSIQL